MSNSPTSGFDQLLISDEHSERNRPQSKNPKSSSLLFRSCLQISKADQLGPSDHVFRPYLQSRSGSDLFPAKAGKGSLPRSWYRAEQVGRKSGSAPFSDKSEESDAMMPRHQGKQATLLIKSYFAQFKCITGNPLYKFLPDGKMIVQIFYFIPYSLFDRQGVSQETHISFADELGTPDQQSGSASSSDKSEVSDAVTGLSETKVNALGVALSELLFKKKADAGSDLQIMSSYKPEESDAVMPECRVELRLIRIQYPYLDSSILAEYIALNACKYNFFRMQKMVFKKAPTVKTEGTMTKEKTPSFKRSKIATSDHVFRPAEQVGRKSGSARHNSRGSDHFPATSHDQQSGSATFPYHTGRVTEKLEKIAGNRSLSRSKYRAVLGPGLTGIKLELSGRLTTQHSTPRKTVENQHTGTLNKGNKFADSKNDSLNLNQYASKNKKGAYTVKVGLGT